MNRSDLTLGITMILLAGVLWFLLIPNGVVVPGGIENFYQAPDFWVKVITIGIFLTGLLLSIKGDLRPLNDPQALLPVMPKILRLSSGIVIFFAYYILLDKIGIIVGSAIAIFAVALIYGERRFQYVLPISILLPVGLYFFFLKIASIPLPVGILEGLGPF